MGNNDDNGKQWDAMGTTGSNGKQWGKMVKKGKNITYEPIPDADRDIKPGDLAFGASEDGLMYT